MPTKKKATAKLPTLDWLSDNPAHERTDSETLAHAIVVDRPDLAVSIAKIMKAELDATGRLTALTLFQTSLTTPGDDNRDPMVAIGRCMPK
ncbi:MAG: hypothetical protein ACO3C1_08360 [Ilumatobacteraceae bacterium]